MVVKRRTEKCRYPSRYSPNGWITGPQLITEVLLEKIAQRQKKDLPMNYWQTSEEWAKLYKNQICAANVLVKDWPVDVVLATLRDKRCWKITSLRAKWLLEPILREKLKLYDEQQRRLEQVEVLVKGPVCEQPQEIKSGSESILSKLEKLE